MLNQEFTPEWLRALIALCTGTQNQPDRTNALAQATGTPITMPSDERGQAMTLEEAIAEIATPALPMPDITAAPIPDTAALPSIDEMQQIFSTACRQRLNTIFATAKLCHFIKNSYSRHDQLQIIGGSMDRPRFDKLAKVAVDERLRPIEHLLPSSETTLILLSNFTDDELAAACQAEIIHPAATRHALTEWRREQRYRAAHRDADPPEMPIYAAIWRVRNAPPETTAALTRLLSEIDALAGVVVTFPPSTSASQIPQQGHADANRLYRF